MQIGERVLIDSKRHLLYGNKGFVTQIRRAFDPWSENVVKVDLDDGRSCLLPPQHVRAA